MQRGAELFPEHPNVLFFLGVVLDRAGNKEGMISQLKKVIELKPDHVQALNYLAYTYAELDRDLPQALKWSTEALRLSPNDGYVLDTMGWILFKQGQYSEAVRYLERAFDLKPREPVIAEHLGDAYSKMQMFERARKAYEHALSMTEDQAQVRTVQTKLSDLQKLVQRPILESGNSLGLGSPERAPASAP
jgi:tetratricopeptide (TPR) repeat protein